MNASNNYHAQKVVIIGGGPAGLATALILAQRGWTNINVLEKRPTADYYEPDKSFSYQIDGRGQKLTDLLNITPKLATLSVANTEFYFSLIQKNGRRKTTKLPIVDPTRKTAYWLPRRTFVQLLYQEIEEHWQDRIQVFFQTRCVAIKRHEAQLEIIAQSSEGKQFNLTPTLLVGCDGLNSIVRQTLSQWEQGKSQRFDMKQFPSPSAGLKYKVLNLPPQFPLSDREGDVAECTMAYGIRGAFTGRHKALSLGVLPLKNPHEPRTANIITYPEHQIWKLETKAEVSHFLEQAFPQLPMEQILSPSEVERFAQSVGGVFPTPQYCSGLYQIWGQPQQFKGTAVILLGDTVHCFPPDIGQGVNSALEDVYLFHEVLAETKDNLELALPRYETLRQNDIQALIRLAQISYPWQYNQAPLRKNLWSLNFFGRLALSRLLPFLFNPHSFLLIQNHQLSYSEILAKSNQTTKILSVLGFLVMLILASYMVLMMGDRL